MMTQVGIHDDDEVTCSILAAMNISCSQAQLRGSRTKHDFVFTVDFHQLLGNILSAIWAPIIDDYDFIVYFAETTEILFAFVA